MATTDRPTAEPVDAESKATVLRDAELGHLVAAADAESVAAAGLLAGACEAAGVPYHVSVVRTRAALVDRLAGTDDAVTPVVLGVETPDAVALNPDGPVSPAAYEVAAALGGDPDPVPALAGVVAAGAAPARSAPDLLEVAGLHRNPGVAVPTPDLAGGLAHSGLVHAPFSGDREAAEDTLAEIGLADASATELSGGDGRRLASLVALAASGTSAAPPRAATAVERALRPYATDGPFATLAGHADVLTALVERAPGLAVAVVMSGTGRAAALEVWRERGRSTHDAVRSAETARYRGVLVARTDGPLSSVARLLRDFASPEPVVLAVGAGAAAVASVDADVTGPLSAAAEAAGGSSLARGRRGRAAFDADRAERFIEAFREAI